MLSTATTSSPLLAKRSASSVGIDTPSDRPSKKSRLSIDFLLSKDPAPPPAPSQLASPPPPPPAFEGVVVAGATNSCGTRLECAPGPSDTDPDTDPNNAATRHVLAHARALPAQAHLPRPHPQHANPPPPPTTSSSSTNLSMTPTPSTPRPSPKIPTISIHKTTPPSHKSILPSPADSTSPSAFPSSPQQQQQQQLAVPNPKPRASKSKPKPKPRQHSPDHVPHHRKLQANALRHEIERLRPLGVALDGRDTPSRKNEGRKLRSQDGSRFKSELSSYFADYDEVIGNEPKQQHDLLYDTPILLFDSASAPAPDPSSFPVRQYPQDIHNNLHAERIDVSALEQAYHNKDPNATAADPLPDSFYAPVHRKAARAERSIRNAERLHAQHERDQVARLLQDLQGPDWLRALGVNGITEGQKHKYEHARRYFIRGCRALVDKFRLWTREERRRKAERLRAHAERLAADAHDEDRDGQDDGESDEGDADESDDDDDEDDDGTPSPPRRRSRAPAAVVVGKRAPAKRKIPAKSPPSLKPKLRLASRAASTKPQEPTIIIADDDHDTIRRPPSPPPREPPEFVSFFRDRRQRETTLNRKRAHHDRDNYDNDDDGVLAWGVKIPDAVAVQRDFALGDWILDKETVRARERNRRREMREARRK